MNKEIKNQPEKKFRAGAVCATIWKNQTEKADKEIEYRTISLERSYQKKTGEWGSTSSFRVNDIPKATLVLQKAYEYVTLKQSYSNEELMV